MRVRVPNALTINTLGGQPFPVSASIEHEGDLTIGYLFPIQLRDLADLVVDVTQPNLLLFGLDRSDYIQNEAGDFIVRPIEDALRDIVEPLANEDGELILRSVDLPRVFGDMETYNAHIVDLPSTEVDIADLWCTGLGHDFRSGPVLPEYPTSRLFVDSHDDCYVYVESREPELPLRMIARLLSTFAATALFNAGASASHVTQPTPQFVSEVLGDKGEFGAAQELAEATDHELRLPFAQVRQRGGDAVATPTHVLTISASDGRWGLERL